MTPSLRCRTLILAALVLPTQALALPLSELYAKLCAHSLGSKNPSQTEWTSFFDSLGAPIAFHSVTSPTQPAVQSTAHTKPRDGLRIASYNVESERYRPVSTPDKLESLTAEMQAVDADVWMIEEIGSEEELDLLAKSLGGDFLVAYIEGNDRNRHLGVIAKKHAKTRLIARSHTRIELDSDGTPTFNRDFPVIMALDESDQAQWMLFGTHYKSKRASADGGSQARKTQVDASIALIQAYRLWMGDKAPIFIAGDFNDDLSSADDFDALWQTGWKNPLAGNKTHFYARRKKGRVDVAEATQLDGILVQSKHADRVTHAAAQDNAFTLASLSNDPEERKRFNQRPSDHLPVFIDIRLSNSTND